jgi:hypothetical protein
MATPSRANIKTFFSVFFEIYIFMFEVTGNFSLNLLSLAGIQSAAANLDSLIPYPNTKKNPCKQCVSLMYTV